MDTFTPIGLLKDKLAELQLNSGSEPNIILEYEKAILILEIIYRGDSVDKFIEPNNSNIFDSIKKEEPQKVPKSYYENFMEAQKNKNNKSK
jgi:hypothetical protein